MSNSVLYLTGASGGIGTELSKLYVNKGFNVIHFVRSCQATDTEICRETDFENPVSGPSLNGLPPPDLVILCAADAGPNDDFSDFQLSDFSRCLNVNAVGQIMFVKQIMARFPNHPFKLVGVSSHLASNQSFRGGLFSYRISKALLNAMFKSIEKDVRHVFPLLIHPGSVRTRMASADAFLSPEESASYISQIIDKANDDDRGRFMDYLGNELPW